MRTRHLATLVVSLAALAVGGTARAETVYVKADRLLDVETGKYVPAPLVTVTDGKIAAVESGGVAPAGAEVIDLAGHREVDADGRAAGRRTVGRGRPRIHAVRG